MKILIDTNVLISAVLRDRNPEKTILFILEQPGYEWIVSPEILSEYKEVLARPKFGIPKALLDRWYSLFDEVTISYPTTESVRFPRDQQDAKFLECALTARADFLNYG